MRSLIQCLAALIGGSGVAFAAYASHGGADVRLAAPAVAILLAHGPALLALSAMMVPGRWMLGAVAAVMAAGVALFAGDLAARIFLGDRLFEGAAPAGGAAIIAAWLALCLEALLPRRY